jgi:hypothetical protein
MIRNYKEDQLQDNVKDYSTQKYIKTVVAPPRNHSELGMPMGIESLSSKKTAEFSLHWVGILSPFAMQTESHAHDFDQYLGFYGRDPANVLELNAVIELTLSEDNIHMEKHIITKATTVFIPAGLYHCPLIFTTVNKPTMFLNLYFSREYTTISKPTKNKQS